MSNKSEYQYGIADLKQLMSRLRDPDGGCPWDRDQSYQSIAPSTLEEAYEVVDAIEKSDFSHLPEELGDLLFQVIFYCQLGSEDALFDFDSVVNALVAKLVRRHPHVFPDGRLNSAGTQEGVNTDSVMQSWEFIKEQERGDKGLHGILDDVPVGLPALSRAQKLQKRLARVGWDWRSVAPMLEKLDEEVVELKQELTSNTSSDEFSREAVAMELGDVLFMTVNIARFLGLDAEACLRASSRKFEQRVRFIERSLQDTGQAISDQESEQLEALWQLAKSSEKSGQL